MSARGYDASAFDTLASTATPAIGTSQTVITRRMTPDQLAEYQRTGTMPASTDVPIVKTEAVDLRPARVPFRSWNAPILLRRHPVPEATSPQSLPSGTA